MKLKKKIEHIVNETELEVKDHERGKLKRDVLLMNVSEGKKYWDIRTRD